MNKEFIPYEQALELKELGFDGLQFGYWIPQIQGGFNISQHRLNDDDIIAPLYQQAFRWFREKQNLIYSIIPESDSGHRLLTRTYNVFIHTFIMNVNVQSEILRVDDKISTYNSYEEAELACLKKLIEIAKNK